MAAFKKGDMNLAGALLTPEGLGYSWGPPRGGYNFAGLISHPPGVAPGLKKRVLSFLASIAL